MLLHRLQKNTIFNRSTLHQLSKTKEKRCIKAKPLALGLNRPAVRITPAYGCLLLNGTNVFGLK